MVIMMTYFVCEYMRAALIFFKMCFFVQLTFLIEKNAYTYVRSLFLIM